MISWCNKRYVKPKDAFKLRVYHIKGQIPATVFGGPEPVVWLRDAPVISEFVLSLTDEDFVRGNYAGRDYEFDQWSPETGKVPAINYLYVGCKELSKELINAAKDFCKKNRV